MLSLNAHVEQRLHNDQLVWLTTVRPDGRPHVVPVWFFWDGQTLLISSQPNAQKLRNLRHNPHVMLALDEAGKLGDDVIMVEGTAEVLNATSVSLLSTLPALAEKLDAYLQKAHSIGFLTQYPDPQAILVDYSQPIRVTPTRFLFW